MRCPECSYDGSDGWQVSDVDQEPDGTYIEGWFCPECGAEICRNGDCGPDEFGQIPGQPGNFYESHPSSSWNRERL